MSIPRARELQEYSWTLQEEGRLDEAAAACREAVALIDATDEHEALDYANLLNDLAEFESQRGQVAEALALAEQASQIALPRGADAEDTARVRVKSLILAASLRRASGTSFGVAWSELLEAEAIAVVTFGEPSEEAAVIWNELGLLCKASGRLDEGMQFYDRALASMTGLAGDHLAASGAILHNIGGLLHERGDYQTAELPSRVAWQISRHKLGPEHPQTMADAVAHAAVLDALGRHEESERLCREALPIFEQAYGPEHEEVAATLLNLGASVESRGDAREAEACYRRALAIHEQHFGRDSLQAAIARNNLGKLLSSNGRSAEGLSLLQSSLAVLERRFPAAHPHVARVRANVRDADGGQAAGASVRTLTAGLPPNFASRA